MEEFLLTYLKRCQSYLTFHTPLSSLLMENMVLLKMMGHGVVWLDQGTADSEKNGRQDQFLDLIHGQGGEGGIRTISPRKKGAQLCVTQPDEKSTPRMQWCYQWCYQRVKISLFGSIISSTIASEG